MADNMKDSFLHILVFLAISTSVRKRMQTLYQVVDHSLIFCWCTQVNFWGVAPPGQVPGLNTNNSMPNTGAGMSYPNHLGLMTSQMLMVRSQLDVWCCVSLKLLSFCKGEIFSTFALFMSEFHERKINCFKVVYFHLKCFAII